MFAVFLLAVQERVSSVKLALMFHRAKCLKTSAEVLVGP